MPLAGTAELAVHVSLSSYSLVKEPAGHPAQNPYPRDNDADPGYSRTTASGCQEDQRGERKAEAGAAAVSEAYIGPAPFPCQQTPSEKLHQTGRQAPGVAAKPRGCWLLARREIPGPARPAEPAKVFPATSGCGPDAPTSCGRDKEGKRASEGP